MDTNIVKRAGSAFRQGDYRTARMLYQQAAAQYGQHLFKANLALCDRALEGRHLPVNAQAAAGTASADSSEGRQLAETQRLLETYFIRCQELEQQLMDRH